MKTSTDLHFDVADVVPVRYDPHNRAKIELDEDALRAKQQRAREALQRHLDKAGEQAVREAEARLANKRQPLGPGGSS